MPGSTRIAVIRRGEESMPTKTPEKKATTKAGGSGKSSALQKPLQPSKELAAVVGPGAQSAEPGRPPRDPGRRQAQQGVRQGQGDHVRDEQAPGPAPHVTASRRSAPARGVAVPAMLPGRIVRHRPVLSAGILGDKRAL